MTVTAPNKFKRNRATLPTKLRNVVNATNDAPFPKSFHCPYLTTAEIKQQSETNCKEKISN